MANDKVILGYWNTRGLGQSCRMVLEHLEVPYEDKQYTLRKSETGEWSVAEWAKDKYSLDIPFPNLPYIIDGDVKLSQSNAVIKYIARKYSKDGSMLGKDQAAMARVDQIIDVIADLNKAMTAAVYCGPDEVDAKMKSLLSNDVKKFLRSFADFLKGKKYLMGDYLTVADFILYEKIHVLRLMYPDIYDSPEHEIFKTYLYSVASLPKVAEFIASDRCEQKQVNNYVAAWQGPTAVDAPRG